MEFVLYPETYEPLRELLTADFNIRGILNLWLRVCKDLEHHPRNEDAILRTAWIDCA